VDYEDTNDAERLAQDPAFRMLASRERRETSAALTSMLHWLETEALAQERNYQELSRLNTDLVQHEITRPSTRRVTLAKVEHHLGELFPRVGFIVTTLTGTNRTSSASTTTAGRLSNGSRRAKPPPTGRASPVTGFGRTRSVCSSASLRTTSAISCAGSRCPSPSRAGH
jgi:hypothetical protein